MKKLLSLYAFLVACTANAQTSSTKISVIAYYAGNATAIDAYPVEKLTHIIFSFCHLQGNELHVDKMADTLTIQHLVELKKRNPSLKIILSLGGWSGCKTCSEVFATKKGRSAFAGSVKHLNAYFKTDGIDIDWEYPAIPGFPGHQYLPEDKQNFTALMKELRRKLGRKYEISFAAGGLDNFLHESVEWNKIARYVDKVNLMSYDLVHGNSTVTGHHTPLYSTPQQAASADNAIRFFDSIHFPLSKVVIGAAMYGRIFNVNNDAENGLYQPGSFDHGISWKSFDRQAMEQQGYVYYWDDTAKAPYMYNKAQHKLFTYDNEQSMALKTKYAIDKGLNGIMFWQLGDDKPAGGLLDAIDAALH
ncbi:glycoside hydrolase family 18 protein [Parafilimonas sp.]|uniref:glycoside hydrolase family 18 protein n=1 Tax=Parafilimonas sp. TaxID=1969739 RepID=UPI0039E6667A